MYNKGSWNAGQRNILPQYKGRDPVRPRQLSEQEAYLDSQLRARPNSHNGRASNFANPKFQSTNFMPTTPQQMPLYRYHSSSGNSSGFYLLIMSIICLVFTRNFAAAQQMAPTITNTSGFTPLPPGFYPFPEPKPVHSPLYDKTTGPLYDKTTGCSLSSYHSRQNLPLPTPKMQSTKSAGDDAMKAISSMQSVLESVQLSASAGHLRSATQSTQEIQQIVDYTTQQIIDSCMRNVQFPSSTIEDQRFIKEKLAEVDCQLSTHLSKEVSIDELKAAIDIVGKYSGSESYRTERIIETLRNKKTT